MAKRYPAYNDPLDGFREEIAHNLALIRAYAGLAEDHVYIRDDVGLGYDLDKLIGYVRSVAFVFDDLKKSKIKKAEDADAA